MHAWCSGVSRWKSNGVSSTAGLRSSTATISASPRRHAMWSGVHSVPGSTALARRRPLRWQRKRVRSIQHSFVNGKAHRQPESAQRTGQAYVSKINDVNLALCAGQPDCAGQHGEAKYTVVVANSAESQNLFLRYSST
eukprot:154858-Chlamydomonas_euryale.AAC.1